MGGDLAKIEAFFCDLAPAPHTGKPMPPGMINALVRHARNPRSPHPVLEPPPGSRQRACPMRRGAECGVVRAQIRVPAEAKTCSEEEFLGCVRRNLDPTDSADHLLPTIKKHTV